MSLYKSAQLRLAFIKLTGSQEKTLAKDQMNDVTQQ